MKLSISNIAWASDDDAEMLPFVQKCGFQGLEIAPTRIFPTLPYDHLAEARRWANDLSEKYGLVVPSMQSIWFGHTEKIFGTTEERNILIDYTKKAILFAEAIGCGNLVFGNPKNRDTENIEEEMDLALDFFHLIGEYAVQHATIVSLEPNPSIYGTHFMNYTKEAVEMAHRVNSEGIKVNFDLGTVIQNKESLDDIMQYHNIINHVHISEPYLNLLEQRDMHSHLFSILKETNYQKYVSIEMGNKGDLQRVKDIMVYIKSIADEV